MTFGARRDDAVDATIGLDQSATLPGLADSTEKHRRTFFPAHPERSARRSSQASSCVTSRSMTVWRGPPPSTATEKRTPGSASRTLRPHPGSPRPDLPSIENDPGAFASDVAARWRSPRGRSRGRARVEAFTRDEPIDSIATSAPTASVGVSLNRLSVPVLRTRRGSRP
jgi:hypothetical protein